MCTKRRKVYRKCIWKHQLPPDTQITREARCVILASKEHKQYPSKSYETI